MDRRHAPRLNREQQAANKANGGHTRFTSKLHESRVRLAEALIGQLYGKGKGWSGDLGEMPPRALVDLISYTTGLTSVAGINVEPLGFEPRITTVPRAIHPQVRKLYVDPLYKMFEDEDEDTPYWLMVFYCIAARIDPVAVAALLNRADLPRAERQRWEKAMRMVVQQQQGGFARSGAESLLVEEAEAPHLRVPAKEVVATLKSDAPRVELADLKSDDEIIKAVKVVPKEATALKSKDAVVPRSEEAETRLFSPVLVGLLRTQQSQLLCGIPDHGGRFSGITLYQRFEVGDRAQLARMQRDVADPTSLPRLNELWSLILLMRRTASQIGAILDPKLSEENKRHFSRKRHGPFRPYRGVAKEWFEARENPAIRLSLMLLESTLTAQIKAADAYTEVEQEPPRFDPVKEWPLHMMLTIFQLPKSHNMAAAVLKSDPTADFNRIRVILSDADDVKEDRNRSVHKWWSDTHRLYDKVDSLLDEPRLAEEARVKRGARRDEADLDVDAGALRAQVDGAQAKTQHADYSHELSRIGREVTFDALRAPIALVRYQQTLWILLTRLTFDELRASAEPVCSVADMKAYIRAELQRFDAYVHANGRSPNAYNAAAVSGSLKMVAASRSQQWTTPIRPVLFDTIFALRSARAVRRGVNWDYEIIAELQALTEKVFAAFDAYAPSVPFKQVVEESKQLGTPAHWAQFSRAMWEDDVRAATLVIRRIAGADAVQSGRLATLFAHGSFVSLIASRAPVTGPFDDTCWYEVLEVLEAHAARARVMLNHLIAGK